MPSVLSSGFSFSNSNYDYDNTNTNVGSHLCYHDGVNLASMAKNNIILQGFSIRHLPEKKTFKKQRHEA